MLVHAVMAGGIGSRLFGPTGGLKALAPLDNSVVLVDYIVDEARLLRADLCLVAITSRGQPIIDHIRSCLNIEVRAVHQDLPGTGGAVGALLSESPDDARMFLTTSDLFGDPGSVASALGSVDEALDTNEPVCLLAVSLPHPNDRSPIYVHVPASGAEPARVMDYGKDVPPSQFVFSGARLLNAAFSRMLLDLVREIPSASDTQLMKRAVGDGAKVYAVSTPSVFDVDDGDALHLARALHQGRSARP